MQQHGETSTGESGPHLHAWDCISSDAPVTGAFETLWARTERLVPPPELPEIQGVTTRLGLSGKTRLALGVAAISFAVTVPDISLGAMGVPQARIDIRAPALPIGTQVWSPSVGASNPVYAPVIAAEQLAPASISFSRVDTERLRGDTPAFLARATQRDLLFLEQGSERFRLAFAEPFRPVPTLSGRQLAETQLGVTAPRPRESGPLSVLAPLRQDGGMRLVDIPQIQGQGVQGQGSAGQGSLGQGNLGQGSLGRATQGQGRRSIVDNARQSAPGGSQVLPTSAARDLSSTMSDQAIEAAFAGVIDVSGGVRSAIPTSRPVSPARSSSSAPAPSSTPAPAPAPRTPGAPNPGIVAIPTPSPDLRASARAQTELVPRSSLGARVNGVLAGTVDFHQLDGTIAVRLGSIVDILSTRFSRAELDRLRAGSSIDAFIPLSQLQAAGIPISYDPVYDEVAFGIDYADAPNANRVQVEQIGAPTLGDERTQIDQLPR